MKPPCLFLLWTRCRVAALAAMLAACACVAEATTASFQGLPFSRSYPLDEIADVPRGDRLTFDEFGRVALVQEGAFAVLNDTVWINRARVDVPQLKKMAYVVFGTDGTGYFGTRGSWGLVKARTDGLLEPESMRPADAPEWTKTAFFDDILITADGTYFGSWNGVVHWDPVKRRTTLFEQAESTRIFRVGDRVYISGHQRPFAEVDLSSSTLRPLPTANPGSAVEHATTLDAGHALLSLADGRLVIFDGTTVSPWEAQERHALRGRVSALCSLADGGVAVALTGKGVYLISAAGEMVQSLTTSQYGLVTSLGSREAGVLWVVSENAIEKILYTGPVTSFGERLGLPIAWPIVQDWNGHVVVGSDGKLYQGIPAADGGAGHFELFAPQPAGGAWTHAVVDGHLLAGNAPTLYEWMGDRWAKIAEVGGLAHLVATADGRCFAIGREQIALFRHKDGRWVEEGERIEGMRFIPIVHAFGNSVWIELGPEGVARVSFEEGRLRLQVIDPGWRNFTWINLGYIDGVVILTDPDGLRAYYSEREGRFIQSPELDKLLGMSEEWILRAEKDSHGTIWAAHSQGIVTYEPTSRGYHLDRNRFELNNEHFPRVQLVNGSDVWISTQRTLHHVDRERIGAPPPVLQPVFVSMLDIRNGTELLRARRGGSVLSLPYDQNNLSLRIFSGGYTWRRPPVYQFRLSGDRPWTRLDAGSALNLTELPEGLHKLEVKTEGEAQPAVPLLFEIRPPWYRTPVAYVVYSLSFGFALVAMGYAIIRMARRRNLVLERLVRERTHELNLAMERLGVETRNAATLEERNRLAGEIHDSLQQGLSGAIIQLDTTMKMSGLPETVLTRLKVVRSMISFTRHEVQHAVWDMETPLLEDTGLSEAIEKLVSLIHSVGVAIETRSSGETLPLPRTVMHHLLRITQEAITNAVRHARASHIAIELCYTEDAVTVSIKDDGIGFIADDTHLKTAGHFGLRGMRSRAKKIGAVLHVSSTPGAGALVTVTLRVCQSLPTHKLLHA